MPVEVVVPHPVLCAPHPEAGIVDEGGLSSYFPSVLAWFALLIAATASTPWPALAREENADPLEEIVVVGSHFDDASLRAETQHSIDRAALDMMRPGEPEQLLQRLPGISVFRPGGPGGVSEVFVRGAESNFTAVFVDGVRLNNPSNTRGGSFDFSTLTVNEIEHVHVAMGAMSALYGSDAMGGVIRIETAYPQAGTRLAYMEAGTEGGWRIGGAASVGLGEATALSVRASALDGGDAVDGSELELINLAARLAGRWATDDRWQIHLRHVDRSRTTFPEVSGGPELALLPELETGDYEEWSLSATADWSLSANWKAEIVASWAELEDETDTPPVPPGVLDGQPGFTSLSDYRRGEVLWINRFATGERSRLALGLDLVDERGRDDGAIDLGFVELPSRYRLGRTTASAFLELVNVWAADLTSTVAVRVDRGDSDSRTSFKAGLAKVFPEHGGRLWARVANGFKLPSFFALGNPLFGNPELHSEKVESGELGYDRTFGNGGEAGFSLFASRFEDLVDFDFETFTHINRGKVDIYGVYLHARLPLGPGLWLSADATLSDISSGSDPLRRRPEHTGGLNLTWQPADGWSLDAAVRYVGERLTTAIPTGDVVDGDYVAVDATLRHQPGDHLALWIAVDNVLDADYQDAPGFPAPGARARVGAELRF